MSKGSLAVFEERGPLVLEALVAGVSIADAARQHGVSVGAVKRWLRCGRDDPESRYGPFAEAVDAARAGRELPDHLPPDEGELRLLASVAARKGTVQAMRLLWEMLRAKTEEGARAPDPMSLVDELAASRLRSNGLDSGDTA